MITPGDLGRELWKQALEIRGFAGKEFSSVTTDCQRLSVARPT